MVVCTVTTTGLYIGMQSFVLIAVPRDSPQSLFCREVVRKQNLISIYIFRAVGMLYCTCEGMPCLRNPSAAQPPIADHSKLGQVFTKIGSGWWNCMQLAARPQEKESGNVSYRQESHLLSAPGLIQGGSGYRETENHRRRTKWIIRVQLVLPSYSPPQQMAEEKLQSFPLNPIASLRSELKSSHLDGGGEL